MAAATRSSTSIKKGVLHRVFKEILELEDDSNLHRACEHDNVDSIHDLLDFSPAEIVDLTYLEGSTRTRISKGYAGKVFCTMPLVRP